MLADVENVLTQRPGFDPASDARTFTVLGSDYVTFILLRHFVPALYAQAPGVTIRISPLAVGFQQSLDRGDADVLILPAEFDRELLRFPHSRLFTDDFVGVVWAGNAEVGDSLTAEEFSRVPQLAGEPGLLAGLPETRLTQLGVHREIEVTARTFVMGPLLVRGTRLLTGAQEGRGRTRRTGGRSAGRDSVRPGNDHSDHVLASSVRQRPGPPLAA